MSTDEQAMAAPEHEAPGQVLKARREALGMSIEQIADQLKLAPRQVVALEAGDYENLPPAAVVRGFVRGYAKVLKLDATPLVAAIPVDAAAAAADASTTVRREKVASLPKVRYPSHGKRSRFPVGAVVLAALAIAGLAAAWHFGLLPTGGDAGAPATSTTTVAPPAVSGSEPVAAPLVAPAVNGAAPADPALQQQTVPLISVPPPAPDPSAPAGTAPANPPAGTAPANPPVTPPAAGQNPPVTTHATMATGTAATAAAAANALVLNVKQDSWVEVRGSGRPLVSRLVKAGSTETVNITEPVTLVVGNPGGVDATLRGAPLALPPLKGSTVSRQKLN
ncbi:MAG TPA: RodZ domain-containing protein [Telluria sp.]|nr:RodZ domain-containing protein [Telluria sp.]